MGGDMSESKSFIRVPTEFLEGCLQKRFSRTQWGILLWVIRQTWGWNRQTTHFSWYRMAKDLALDHGGVVRAGNRLLLSGVLSLHGDQIGIQGTDEFWQNHRLRSAGYGILTNVSTGKSQRKELTILSGVTDKRQWKRCQVSVVFRRTKDSSKDILKTYKHMRLKSRGQRQLEYTEAGAARPITGKYDRVSEN
jgi:hypothetical protein